MAITVKIKMPGIAKLRRQLEGNERLNGAIADAWSTLYRSWARQRFDKLSKGGSVDGDSWKPLAPATIKRRRKGRGSGNAAILRDTGALFAAMQPSVSGGLLSSSTLRPVGVRVELAGPARHKSGPSLVEIATFHHEGGKRFPAREILVRPDQATIDKMVAVAGRIITRELNQ